MHSNTLRYMTGDVRRKVFNGPFGGPQGYLKKWRFRTKDRRSRTQPLQTRFAKRTVASRPEFRFLLFGTGQYVCFIIRSMHETKPKWSNKNMKIQKCEID